MSQPVACRALPGKGQAWRRSEKYEGFSWHSCLRQTILEVGALLDKARSTKGKAQPRAIDWRRLQQLPDGYYLQWKKPVSFAAGYAMFNRLLGQLAYEQGQTSVWRVVGHPHGLEPQLATPAPEATSHRRLRGKRPRPALAHSLPEGHGRAPAVGE